MAKLVVGLFLVLTAANAAAKAQPFADVAKAIEDALKARKSLAPYVDEKGFELVYGGSDRVDGIKKAAPLKLKPKQIDESVEVTVKADGKGWMVEGEKKKPKPRTFKYKVRVADHDFFASSVDEKKKTVMLWNNYMSAEFTFGQGRTWKIRKLSLSEDDPG